VRVACQAGEVIERIGRVQKMATRRLVQQVISQTGAGRGHVLWKARHNEGDARRVRASNNVQQAAWTRALIWWALELVGDDLCLRVECLAAGDFSGRVVF